ncbi:unnamed protein product [Pylaiella littoralis]
MISTQRLLVGACLFAGRTGAFHVPVASSLSGPARSTLAGAAGNAAAVSVHRRVHSTGVLMATAPSGEMQGTIESRLKQALSPVHLEVINESHMHAGPAKESHFKVIVVSDEFEGKSLLARHRIVNSLFTEDMTGKTPKMHALSIQGKTPSQWEAEGHKVAPSPPCMGGSKADASMGSEESITALGATRPGGGAPARTRRKIRSSFVNWRQRRPASVRASAVTAAGLLAVTVWLSFPGNAAASVAATTGPAAKAAAKATERVRVWAEVDEGFWTVADHLGSVINRKNLTPMAQCMMMFHTAWMTKSVCPIACAGAMEQPLERAMIATATSHAAFAALKFFLAVFAMSSFPPVYEQQSPRHSSRNSGSSKPESKPTPKPTASRNKPPMDRPALKLPSRLRPKRRDSPAAAAAAATGTRGGKGQQQPVVRIRLRRSAKSVPKLWLMAVTAIAGPAWGAVGSAVAWKAGIVAIPAALSSLSRGAVIAALVAGSLCYGGVGTEVVARWAVVQAVFGAPFAAVLTPSPLMVVYLCNYYWRVAKSRRSTPGPPPPGMTKKGSAESETNTDLGAKQQQKRRKDADEKDREHAKESTADEEKKRNQD